MVNDDILSLCLPGLFGNECTNVGHFMIPFSDECAFPQHFHFYTGM